MNNIVYNNDIPESLLSIPGDIAVDTEAMGLNYNIRDRLCVVQISFGDNKAYLVHFDGKDYSAPNLRTLLADKNRVKIYHFARFDIAIIKRYLNFWACPVFCTKIASRLTRTYTEYHSLKELCNELLGVRLNKTHQTSNWGAEKLSRAQIDYAAGDVLYLHKIREKLNINLSRCNREEIALRCFEFLQHRCELDLYGWEELDIFHH